MCNISDKQNDFPVFEYRSLKERIALFRKEAASELKVEPEKLRIIKAPLRAAPLGAHIDNQMGKVLGFSITRYVLLGFVETNERSIIVKSYNYRNEGIRKCSLHRDTVPSSSSDWGVYISGAVFALKNYKLKKGLRGYIKSDLLPGGISSSAAVGLSYIRALLLVNGLEVPVRELIRLSKKLENDYLGLKNGKLDQAMISLGSKGKLIQFDCLDNSCEEINLPDNLVWMLVFSGVQQSLLNSDYNLRVEEYLRASKYLLKFSGQERSNVKLREVSPDIWRKFSSRLKQVDYVAWKRASHYFSEMERVQSGIAALDSNRIEDFGELITQSGESTFRMYDAGCEPLKWLHSKLIKVPGVLGSRTSGAGFRGWNVSAVRKDKVNGIYKEVVKILSDYSQIYPKYGELAHVVFVETDNGLACY